MSKHSKPRSKKPKAPNRYEFGKLEKVSLKKALNAKSGEILNIFGHACNCGMCCDVYQCGACDLRCISGCMQCAPIS